jgi:hypothetical protein
MKVVAGHCRSAAQSHLCVSDRPAADSDGRPLSRHRFAQARAKFKQSFTCE